MVLMTTAVQRGAIENDCNTKIMVGTSCTLTTIDIGRRQPFTFQSMELKKVLEIKY